ncbi:MAG: BatA domain-containing protein [Bacteroidota bacterium]|nr:BatA domain-containing protein [Bacteroidota bacterium]
MVLAQPLFLLALTALAIPVVIHLFNFRRYRKIYFSNVRFLQEIRQESRHRSQLKQLLILLMRILAIACLVLAFTRPYIPSPWQHKTGQGKQLVSIYIDNTFSMEALSRNGTLLESARKKAHEIADAYGPSDQFQLLTADFEGQHQRFVSHDEFNTMVDEVHLTPAIRSLKEILTRQAELFTGMHHANAISYIISDFQKSTSGIQDLPSDTNTMHVFVPVSPEKTDNLAIDSAWFDNPIQQPGQTVNLKIRIRNYSGESLEKIPVRLIINEAAKAVASFSIEGNGTQTVTLPYSNNASGIQYGTLEITDYPVTWDDKFFFSYRINSVIPILCINGKKENPFLKALFENDSAFSFRSANINQIDFSIFGHYPLILLNEPDDIPSGLIQELKKYTGNGGNIAFFPGENGSTTQYSAFFNSMEIAGFSGMDTTRQRISEVNLESKLYSNVFEKDASGHVVLPENADLPVVKKYYVIGQKVRSAGEDLLKLQNGKTFLRVTPVGKGQIYLFASPAEEAFTGFPKHPLFVPTLYRIAMLSQPSWPLFHDLSSDQPIELESDSVKSEPVYKIKKTTGGFEFIPEVRNMGTVTLLYTHGQIKEAGQYTIENDGNIIRGLSFNYNRQESDLRCYSTRELQSFLKQSGLKYQTVLASRHAPISGQIREMSQGTPLWKWFVIMTLLFIAAEIAIIRLMKD